MSTSTADQFYSPTNVFERLCATMSEGAYNAGDVKKQAGVCHVSVNRYVRSSQGKPVRSAAGKLQRKRKQMTLRVRGDMLMVKIPKALYEHAAFMETGLVKVGKLGGKFKVIRKGKLYLTTTSKVITVGETRKHYMAWLGKLDAKTEESVESLLKEAYVCGYETEWFGSDIESEGDAETSSGTDVDTKPETANKASYKGTANDDTEPYDSQETDAPSDDSGKTVSGK
jgi:hypothetical protein